MPWNASRVPVLSNCMHADDAQRVYGTAADGYARARGVGVVVTTFTVGGLSAINAVAGAYSENLPLICITGECSRLAESVSAHTHDQMAAA